jgi:small redox-active disulfide protein 2
MDPYLPEESIVKHLKILGPGCARCEQLAKLTKAAADELGCEYELVKITDFNRFVDYGLMVTPGLVVDGELKVHGQVPSIEELKELLR